MSCTSINFYLHKNWIWALKQAQISTANHIYSTWYLLNSFWGFTKQCTKHIFHLLFFCMFLMYYQKRNFMLILMQQTVSWPRQNWWSCEAFCSTAIRSILCMCNVLIQSEHVNTILKYREYCATSTVTKPQIITPAMWCKLQHCKSLACSVAMVLSATG